MTEEALRLIAKHERRVQAEENERKYAFLKSTMPEDNLGTVQGVYEALRSGFDNGDCETRAGTFRKFKTGSGRGGRPQ